MNSHSQCPGEAYDSFWEEENNQPTLNVDKLVKDLHWNGTEFVKTETIYRINYYRGFIPSKQFESDIYQLYLKYASTQELENDIVFYNTMLKMYNEIKELNLRLYKTEIIS
jgi:hypothetical protein